MKAKNYIIFFNISIGSCTDNTYKKCLKIINNCMQCDGGI